MALTRSGCPFRYSLFFLIDFNSTIDYLQASAEFLLKKLSKQSNEMKKAKSSVASIAKSRASYKRGCLPIGQDVPYGEAVGIEVDPVPEPEPDRVTPELPAEVPLAEPEPEPSAVPAALSTPTGLSPTHALDAELPTEPGLVVRRGPYKKTIQAAAVSSAVRRRG